MTKKSLKIALVALVMMPMMALTMNGQSAASTSAPASDRNATGKAPVITVEKRDYSVGDKITVKVSNIPTAAVSSAASSANRNAKEATITVWYEVVELSAVSASAASNARASKKAMKKVSNSEHTLVVDKAWAGKQLKIVAENTTEKVFCNEIVVKINAQASKDSKESNESRKAAAERNTNQPAVTPAEPAPTPTPKPAPAPTPAPTPASDTKTTTR